MRSGGMMTSACVEACTPGSSRTPLAAVSPCSARSRRSSWYRAVTPSSLKRAATVPKTGSDSRPWPGVPRSRATWRRTSRSASSAPRRSNLLIAITSATSSISIFSSWVGAPYSGVITYSETSASSSMPASPWPIPGVSTTTSSAPQAALAAMTSPRCAGRPPGAPPAPSERKNTWGVSIAFIRMRSPRSAPPSRRRVGSTAMTAMRSLSSRSRRNRRSSSSESELLPDPPVPVIPRTGTPREVAAARSEVVTDEGRASRSIEVMARARARRSPDSRASADSIGGRGVVLAIAHISAAMPERPSFAPSSGEKILATPRASRSAISRRMMTPPPPPKTLISGRPRRASSSTR